MNDEGKTKRQLIVELLEMRQRIKELEALQARSEKEPQKKRIPWKELFQSIQAAVVVHSADTKIAESNTAAQELLGLNEAQLLGRESTDPRWKFLREDGTVMPLDEYPVNQVIEKRQKLRNLVAGIRKPDKPETTWVLVNAAPMFGPEDEVSQVVVSFMDVTEHKRTEEALRGSEELANACLNATSDMVYLTDPDGILLTVNDAAAQRLGKSSNELVGTNVLDYFPPDIAKFRKEQGIEAACSGKAVRLSDERNGMCFDTSVYPTLDAQGKVDRLAVFVADISDQKRAEGKLREKKYIIESSSSMIATADFQGKMTYGNPAFLMKWGFKSVTELIGRSLSELWVVEDQLNEIMQELRTKGSWFGETLAKRKDGTIFDVQVSAAVVLDEEGKPAALTSTSVDITERKKAEKEREKLILELQEALSKVNTLSGMLPICASCKKIRDDRGYWRQIESYIRDHSEAEFSHGICPECAAKLYGELDSYRERHRDR